MVEIRGPFAGVSVVDAFARGKLKQEETEEYFKQSMHIGEKSAIQALIVSSVVKSVLARNSMVNAQSFSDFSSIRNHARSELLTGVQEYIENAKVGVNSGESRILARLEQISTGFFDVQRALLPGVNIAVYVMEKIHEIIPQLEDSNVDSNGLIQIARNSFSFIARLAGNKEGDFNSRINLMSGQNPSEPGFEEDKPWRREMLSIRNSRVEFSDCAQGLLYVPAATHSVNKPCPAMWNQNQADGSAVAQLYVWFTNRAKPIYHKIRK